MYGVEREKVVDNVRSGCDSKKIMVYSLALFLVANKVWCCFVPIFFVFLSPIDIGHPQSNSQHWKFGLMDLEWYWWCRMGLTLLV